MDFVDLKREILRLVEKYGLEHAMCETYQSAQLEAYCRVYEDGRWRSKGTGECQLKIDVISPTSEFKHESFTVCYVRGFLIYRLVAVGSC